MGSEISFKADSPLQMALHKQRVVMNSLNDWTFRCQVQQHRIRILIRDEREFLTFTQHLGTLGPQLVSEDPSLLLCMPWHVYTVVESRTVTLVLRRSGKALLTSTRDIHRHRELVPNWPSPQVSPDCVIHYQMPSIHDWYSAVNTASLSAQVTHPPFTQTRTIVTSWQLFCATRRIPSAVWQERIHTG